MSARDAAAEPEAGPAELVPDAEPVLADPDPVERDDLAESQTDDVDSAGS